MKLNGKTAVITGGASGIGKATVIEFLKEGANVVAADWNDKLFAEVQKEIGFGEDRLIFTKADVSKESDVEAMIQLCVDKFGKLDIICNIAGVVGFVGPIEDYPQDLWEQVMGVNATGVLWGCKHAIKPMRANGGGSIINLASMMAHNGAPHQCGYNASKHAALGITRCVAYEYSKEGIRCNAVSPGYVKTPLMDFASAEQMKGYAAMHLLERCAEPIEIAKCMVFVASDDASFMTGSSLIVDGGYLQKHI